MTFDRNSLENAGFQGFIPISKLKTSGTSIIPACIGVYVIVRESTASHEFRSESIGGHFKGRNPTMDVSKLGVKWVDNSYVLYIGKAGKSGSKATLRSRLDQYIKFGKGDPIGHWGGRFIWQLSDCDNLLVAWKPLVNEEPREVEKQMIAKFLTVYGKKPFANIAS